MRKARATFLVLPAALALALAAAPRALSQPPPSDAESDARARALFDTAVEAQRSRDYQRAMGAYREVLALKPASASTMNNLAKIQADLGNDAAALELYRSAAAVGDANQAFYQKQYADLLSRSNRSAAIAEYRNLLAKGVTQVRRDLTNLYVSGPPGELVGYLWELSEAGEAVTAAEIALAALENGNQDQSTDFLTIVTRVLGHDTLSLERSAALLARLEPLTSNAAVGAGVRSVLALHEAPSGDFRWWAERGSAWEDPDYGLWPRDAFRMLARTLGLRAERAGDFARAEAYYRSAAELDQEELDPLAFQALCKLFVRQNDLQKLQAIVSDFRYVDRLFSAKNEAYRRGQLAKIYDYHVTLGYIFGSLAQRGAMPWGDSSTPASAVFQLERAMQVGAAIDQRTNAASADAAPHVDAGVVELLAAYYEQRNAARATQLRVDAARRLSDAGRLNTAKEIVRPVPAETLRQRDAALYRRLENGN